MIELGENYYLISKKEITNDMVLLTDGIYTSGENYYEVFDDTNNSSATSQSSNKNQTNTMNSNKNQTNTASSNYLTILFIFGVLLLSFAVLCIYIGTTNIVTYFRIHEEISKLSNQFGVAGEMVTGQANNHYLRYGVLWIIGGVASLILGGFLALIYHSKE